MEDSRINLFVHRENMLWAPKKRHLPVTLVTGFLGAGKTTLLNHVLSNKHNLKIAAAVNDFAERNIDAQIIKKNRDHGEVVELTNGCLCCSISGELKTAVWSLLQQADIGKIDYLMIETSGVADPLATIATLEEEYGKMYRIRLDSVVTVVDTDALVAGIEGGSEGESKLQSAAADSQLACADVVLLNKKDLVSEDQLSRARDFISKLVPGAQVYSCNKCAVPLHCLMEVQETESMQVVSHEVVDSAYTISQTGGSMNQERQRRLREKGTAASFTHIKQDEFSSFVFESLRPFRLGDFQAFLGKNFPQGVTRVKGTVWFQENRSCLYSFHMSGRQRYELTLCASAGESLVGAFSVQLVIIGRSIVPGEIQTTLENSVVPEQEPGESSSPAAAVADAARCLVQADNRFELVAFENLCVDFRLTGCVEYGVTLQEAETIHGINLRRMNLDLATRVNGSSMPVCILPVLLPTGLQVCRYAAHADAPFDVLWRLVTEIGEKLIVEYYRAVSYCKCGM